MLSIHARHLWSNIAYTGDLQECLVGEIPNLGARNPHLDASMPGSILNL